VFVNSQEEMSGLLSLIEPVRNELEKKENKYHITPVLASLHWLPVKARAV
jgi:hypothetical protein